MAISNVVSSGLGHFEDKFTVAISNVVSSRLGPIERQFTVAISNKGLFD